MRSKRGFVRGALLASLLLVVLAGTGYGASSGSQTVSITAGVVLALTVPATATIVSTGPGACGSTSTTITVNSNKLWNLQVRANAGYADGKPKNGTTEMVNVFQYSGGDVDTFTDITSIYAYLFAGSQPKTGGPGTNVVANYQQCVDWLDDPVTYTIVVEYLAVQPP